MQWRSKEGEIEGVNEHGNGVGERRGEGENEMKEGMEERKREGGKGVTGQMEGERVSLQTHRVLHENETRQGAR